MKIDMQKIILTTLCSLVLAYVGRMIVGVISLARLQGVTWHWNILAPSHEVPVVAVVFEVSMFIGAALIPLLAAWRPEMRRKKWLLYGWSPCILYVLFLAISFFVRVPFTISSSVLGVGRLSAWIVIAALFIRISRKTKLAQL